MDHGVEQEEIIFEFWNSFKGSKTFTKVDPKTRNPIYWHSHNKLTHDMRVAIRENLKDYSLEEMCIAISNYAKVLLGDEYFWTYVWPLSIFFMVKYEKRKDGARKWWKFLPENFNEQNYFIVEKSGWSRNFDKKSSPDLELTNMIIKGYGTYKGNRGYQSLAQDYSKFVEATELMFLFHEENPCQSKECWIEDLFEMLKNRYGDKGNGVTPAYICSVNTWHELMSEYYTHALGVGHSWISSGVKRVREYFDSKNGN